MLVCLTPRALCPFWVQQAPSAAADVLGRVRRAADATLIQRAETKETTIIVQMSNEAAVVMQECWRRRCLRRVPCDEKLFTGRRSIDAYRRVLIQAFERGMAVHCATCTTSKAVASVKARARRRRGRSNTPYIQGRRGETVHGPAVEATTDRLDLEHRALLHMRAV